MYCLIRTLNRSGVAIIMISHDLEGALNDATHVLEVAERSAIYQTADEYSGGLLHD